MKKFFVMMAAATMILSGCGASTQVASTKKSVNPDGQLLENNPCIEYAMMKPKTRAYGDGTHFKESTATNIAEAQARGKFARRIEAAVLSATEEIGISLEKYSGDAMGGSSATDQSAEANDMVSSIAAQCIKNTYIVKISRYYTENQQYKIYVCLEFGGSEDEMADQIVQSVVDKISEADRAKIEARHDDFRNRVYNNLKD